MKVVLISVDGMRPDALPGLAQAEKMKKKSTYSMTVQTVFPSVTLPCHMSMFHSVGPERHGTTTNTYMPQVRPIDGLVEQLKKAGKHSAFFYNWEELRDLSRPGSLDHSLCCSQRDEKGGKDYEVLNTAATDAAIEHIRDHAPDFVFLYLGWLDEAGHAYGWMSEEYYRALEGSWNDIERLMETLPEDYTVIVTSDHGGHDRSHGTTMPEDMTIPAFFCGPDFEAGKEMNGLSIKDIAPTIAALLGASPAPEWEGRSIVNE